MYELTDNELLQVEGGKIKLPPSEVSFKVEAKKTDKGNEVSASVTLTWKF